MGDSWGPQTQQGRTLARERLNIDLQNAAPAEIWSTCVRPPGREPLGPTARRRGTATRRRRGEGPEALACSPQFSYPRLRRPKRGTWKVCGRRLSRRFEVGEIAEGVAVVPELLLEDRVQALLQWIDAVLEHVDRSGEVGRRQ